MKKLIKTKFKKCGRMTKKYWNETIWSRIQSLFNTTKTRRYPLNSKFVRKDNMKGENQIIVYNSNEKTGGVCMENENIPDGEYAEDNVPKVK